MSPRTPSAAGPAPPAGPATAAAPSGAGPAPSAAGPAPSAAGPPARVRRVVLALVLVAAAVLLFAVEGQSSSGGPPYDPGSTSPDGAKALALLLAQVGPGITQATAPPQPGSGGVVLDLDDAVDHADVEQLVAWVKAGGTLVAADADLVANFAAMAREPGPEGFVTASGTIPTGCADPGLAGVSSVDPAGDASLRVPPGATGCFDPPDGGSFLVVEPMGNGNLVLLGGPDLWTNRYLGHHDNGLLAVDVLSPRPDAPPIQWITGPIAGGGSQSLSSLVPGRVWEALALLVAVLVLVALWRGRRLGQPVLEVPPVELPGSELVVAVGSLLHQGGRLDDAAGILRATLRRAIVDRLGVPPDAPPEAMVAVVSARTGLDPGIIGATVAGPVPSTESELVALAANADAIERGMAHAR